MYLRDTDLRNMKEEMKKEIEFFSKNFTDTPERLSGWGHDYFCDIDGGALIFDYNKPHEHECPVCGKIYTGIKYDQCWLYAYRYNLICSLTKASFLYKEEKDRKYLDYIVKILDFYSENYKNFKIQAKGKIVKDPNIDVGGASRIMPQGLNEAIMLIRITNALEIVKSELDQEWIKKLDTLLFQPAIELLNRQRIRIHNIALWISTAIASVALLTGDRKRVDEVYNGEFGIANQIRKGFTEDGFWYEGSIHYNYFALEGVMNFLLFAEINKYEVEKDVMEKVLHILKAPYSYAFDNLMLPNPNDGWPNLGLKTYSFIYYLAYRVYGDKIIDLLATIENNKDTRTDVALSKPYYFENRIPLERIIFAKDLDLAGRGLEKERSKVFNKSSFAMLKNDRINVFLKSGHQTKSHAHPDKMTIEVTVDEKYLSRDLSNPGYGSKICNEWNRESISHNTVVIDGISHDAIEPGRIVKFTEDNVKIETESVYEGKEIAYSREITLMKNGFEDIFTVSSEENSLKDWVFHIESDIVLENVSVEFADGDIELAENGYQHLMEVNKLKKADYVDFIWDFYGKKLMNRLYTENKAVFIGKSYDNPANKHRTTIIVRTRKNQETFKNIWKMEE